MSVAKMSPFSWLCKRGLPRVINSSGQKEKLKEEKSNFPNLLAEPHYSILLTVSATKVWPYYALLYLCVSIQATGITDRRCPCIQEAQTKSRKGRAPTRNRFSPIKHHKVNPHHYLLRQVNKMHSFQHLEFHLS